MVSLKVTNLILFNIPIQYIKLLQVFPGILIDCFDFRYLFFAGSHMNSSEKGTLPQEHILFTDQDSQLYHFSVEGHSIRDGTKVSTVPYRSLLVVGGTRYHT